MGKSLANSNTKWRECMGTQDPLGHRTLGILHTRPENPASENRDWRATAVVVSLKPSPFWHAVASGINYRLP